MTTDERKLVFRILHFLGEASDARYETLRDYRTLVDHRVNKLANVPNVDGPELRQFATIVKREFVGSKPAGRAESEERVSKLAKKLRETHERATNRLLFASEAAVHLTEVESMWHKLAREIVEDFER